MAKSAFDAVADSFADSMASAMKTAFTFWTSVPSPDLAANGVVAKLVGYTYWVQGFVLVLSLVIVACKLCMGRDPRPAADALKGLGFLILTTGASVAGIDILGHAGDSFSTWVISQAADGDLGARLVVLTGGAATMGPLGVGLEFTLAFFGILAAVCQVLLLIARIGVLTLLTGVLPLAASAAVGGDAGKAWFQKLLAWIFAFLAYKPVAALVYAAAFSLIGSSKDLISMISGLMLVILAVLALPALMKLVMPAVGAATSSGGGAIAGALAGAALATGAKSLSNSRAPKQPPPPPGGPPGGGSTGPGQGASGAVAVGASTAGSGAGAGGAGAAGGAAGAGAGAGPVVAAAVQGYQAAKSGANGAAGGGSGTP